MRVSLLLSLLLVPACGLDTSPTATGPIQQPRLERVGSTGAAQYDGQGFPARIDALAGTYRLTWSEAGLKIATLTTKDRVVQARFEHAAGLLVEMSATCMGDCPGGKARHDAFAYGNHTSALASWETVAATSMRRTYRYDELGRLVATDDTQLTYNVDGCPHRATTAGATIEYVYADDGRLASIADDRGVVGIDYNERGLIQQFEASAQVLEYADGEAMGLDLWPGHLFGGAANGYPAHGELFHLDGNCDPALRSQGTILALVLGSL